VIPDAETFNRELEEAIRLGTRIEEILRRLLAFVEQSETEEATR
jgi:hypothetical protein